MLWFTSDHHFGHQRILEYCNRPFASIGEMDDALVDAWNNAVKEGDRVYYLGDFTLGSDALRYFRRLNGYIRALRLPWHHDYRWIEQHGAIVAAVGVECLPPMHVINVPDILINGWALNITLSHYPMESWEQSHRGHWHLHGHVHGTREPRVGQGCILDVGVDSAYKLLGSYRPFSLDEVKEIMATRSPA